MLSQYAPYVPRTYGRYFEPFVGSGAVFFWLKPPRAFLSDLNVELVNCYQIVKSHVEELIRALSKMNRNEKQFYYKVRSLNPGDLSPVERAARTIFLNRTCFNGLYRVNRAGRFNVPFGRYTNPRILDAENLRACSAALKHAQVIAGDYTKVCGKAIAGDLVYFDPPYQPLTKTAYFTQYVQGGFTEADQERLAMLFDELDHRGCLVMLSNSGTDFIRRLYKRHRQIAIRARRAINCKPERRGEITELLILNF